MRFRGERLVVVGLTLVAGCRGEDRRGTGFRFDEPAAPAPVVVLRNDSSRTAEGYRVAELDVLLEPTVDEAGARATLQHIIDSVAAADTAAVAVRVMGYVMGEVDVAMAAADIVPGIRATWGPIDTLGFTGPRRRSRYRTEYVLLRPFRTPGDDGRTP